MILRSVIIIEQTISFYLRRLPSYICTFASFRVCASGARPLQKSDNTYFFLFFLFVLSALKKRAPGRIGFYYLMGQKPCA